MLTDELLNYLFDGQSHLLGAPLEQWLTSSHRFTAFVNDHRTKIRKKLRTAQDPERIRDLQLEFETAYLLLREKSLSLEYEPLHPRDGRSPDFAVTFTTSLTFMVEATRMRKLPSGAQEQTFDDRFTDMLCSKLGQLLPQRGNLLLVGAEDLYLTPDELSSTLLQLQRRAEANDSTLIQRHGFRDRTDFFRHYQRLSLLLVRGIPLDARQPLNWDNPQGKYLLPAKVRTTLLHSHGV